MSSVEESAESYNNDPLDELISHDSDYDIGIHYFENMIRRNYVSIVNHNSQNGSTNDNIYKNEWGFSGVDVLQNTVDDTWEFYGSHATVSGIVYIDNTQYDVAIPEGWEQVDIASVYKKGTAYFVDSVQLVSKGVIVNQDVDSVKYQSEPVFKYFFALPDDEFELPIIYAFSNDLTKHSYDIPSTAEAERRLFRDYSDQVDIINTLMKDGASNVVHLPLRLKMLVRKLQTELQTSRDFRTAAEIYINQKVQFHSELPYFMKIKNAIKISNVTTEWEVPEDDEFQEYILDTPLSLTAISPMIRFVSRDKLVTTEIVGRNYSEDGGDDADIFIVDLDNLEQIKATFTTTRLGERALRSHDMYSSIEQFSGVDVSEDDINSVHDVIITAHFLRNNQERSRYIDGKPQHIIDAEERMERLGDYLNQIKELQEVVFDSEIEAEASAKEIVYDKILPLFNEISETKSLLLFSGQGTRVPDMVVRDPWDTGSSTLDNQRTHTTDDRNILRVVGQTEKVIGLPTVLKLNAQRIDTLDDDGVGYIVRPYLVAKIAVKKRPIVSYNGDQLVNETVEEYAVIQLDGSASIQDMAIERYNALRTTMQIVSEQYPRHPVVGKLHRLRRALGSRAENIYDYDELHELHDLETIRSLGRSVMHMQESQENVSAIVEAIEAMFLNRIIVVSGTLFTKTSGQLRHIEDNTKGLEAEVVDIDISTGQIMFVVRETQSNVIYFTPFDGIESLGF